MKRFPLALAALACTGAAAQLPATFAVEPAAAVAEAAYSVKSVVPTETINLLPKDLKSVYYTWLADAHYEDPRNIFQMQDDGILRISGDGYGGLVTHKEYSDYYLVLEYRWGTKTWGDRKDRARDSGILLHSQGPDGNFGGSKDKPGPWMTSIEFQIIEGGVGDILVLRGKDKDGKEMKALATCEVERDRDGEPCWKEGAPAEEFKSGRINWFGRDPDWTDKLDIRGPQDPDSPGQGWTKIECYAKGDTLTYLVNGVVVNRASRVYPTQGKLLLQTEGAEMFVRKFELQPLPSEIP